MILGENQQSFASPSEALEHHGIKGMKWGVRKSEETGGQSGSASNSPTSSPSASNAVKPLSARKQAKVDKFLNRADVMQTRINEIRAENAKYEGSRNLVNRYKRMNNNEIIKSTEKQRQRAVKDSEAVKKGKLTRKQKQVIAGAIVVGAIVGYGLYTQGRSSGALNSWKLMGQARLHGQKVPFKVNKALAGKMSAKDLLSKVAKPVNPGYATAGGKMNCRRSTFAYELRRRGFDVHATTTATGWGQSESGVVNALTTKGKDYFRATSLSQTVSATGRSGLAPGDKRHVPGAKILLDGLRHKDDLGGSSSKKVLEELAKQPNGARGEVLFKFPTFGHSMAYEVVKGVPKIFDSQKGKMYDAATRVESHWDGFNDAEIRRLDNVKLDLNFLSRWATNN
jgi:hypothetical protein